MQTSTQLNSVEDRGEVQLIKLKSDILAVSAIKPNVRFLISSWFV